MRRVFAERLRSLKLKGVTPPVYGVDVPWRTGWAVEQLSAMAKASPGAAATALLKGLPVPMAYLDKRIDAAYVGKTSAYASQIKAAAGMCAALGAARCERARQLATALYLGAFMQSPLYAQASGTEMAAWKASREALMFHNFGVAFASGHKRLYAHMGASHAKKKQGAVAYMLDNDLPATRGAVVTLMPVYGPASEVYYLGATFPMSSYPRVVADAMLAAAVDRAFIPTHAPGARCQANPLSAPSLVTLVGSAGQLYDGYFWVDRLTPAVP